LESAAGWKISAIGDEYSMGDQVDLPIDKKEELQPRRLHGRRSQPVEQLEEVIEEIRRLMLNSVKNYQQEEAEQKGACKSSREEAATTTTKQWSR
jgi:hypothetical protein